MFLLHHPCLETVCIKSILLEGFVFVNPLYVSVVHKHTTPANAG